MHPVAEPVTKKALESDLTILERMEDEATRFGTAVGLDSVSAFECIVDSDQHFFMEMNTDSGRAPGQRTVLRCALKIQTTLRMRSS